MANATQAMSRTMAPEVSGEVSSRALGYAIVCALPAVFWTLVLALASWAMGVELPATTLLAVALSIAAFLAVVMSALLMPRGDERQV